MKTLKKVLALTLVFALALTCAISAAAYTDDSSISKTEAVGMLSVLNVINGKSDGSFDPSGNVTRGEMAKMIYTVRTGGSDDASKYAGLATAFTDISGSWAASYIKYCNSVGIIAGRSATIFDPNASVTGLEVAKMVLVNMGYTAEKAGLVGSTWAVGVTSLAAENGLFDDVDGDIAKACSRENAAQIIYNSLDCDIVKWSNDAEEFIPYYNTIAGMNQSVGEKYFGYEKYEDIVLVGTTYDEDTEKYSVKLVPADDLGAIAQYPDHETSIDYSAYVGQQVTVAIDEDDELLGIFAEEENVAITITAAELRKNVADNDGDFVYDGKKYAVPKKLGDIPLYAPSGEKVDINKLYLASEVTLIDQDAKKTSGKYSIDWAVAVPFTVAEVTYYGTKSMTLQSIKDCGITSAVTGAVQFDDDAYAIGKGIAEEDYVIIVEGKYLVNNTKTTIDKIDVTSASVTAKSTKSFLDYFDQIKVGGEWLVVDRGLTATPAAGDDADLIVVNGVVIYSNATSSTMSADDFAVVTNAYDYKGDPMAVLLFSDGTTKEVVLKNGDDKALNGQLVTYEVEKGKYELTAAPKNTTGTDYEGVYTIDDFKGETGTKVSDRVRVDSAAVIFVEDKDGNYSVITGSKFADMKASSIDNKAGNIYNAYTDTSVSTGYSSIALAFVKVAGTTAVSSDTLYGYVTAAPYTEQNEDKETVTVLTFWDGTASKTLKADSDLGDKIAKGDVFSYSLDSDNVVCDVTVEGSLPKNARAITAYDGTYIQLDSNTKTNYEITKDTVIMYIDYDGNKGAEGGSIRIAPKGNGVDYNKNAFVLDDAGEVTFLLVDIGGDIQ